MFFLSLFFLLFYDVNCLFHSNESTDDIALKIQTYIDEHQIPLVLTAKLIGDEAGSMSSTYHGYLTMTNHTSTSAIVKYSSFKSIWNYVHISDLNHLYDHGCYSHVRPHTNEYLVLKEDKDRIVKEGWIPSEVYVALKAYLCEHLMPTATFVHPKFSYFSFFQSLDQPDDDRAFFLIFKNLDQGISLKKYLDEYSNSISIETANHLISSILFAVLKLQQMFLIHLDLNTRNIFLMNNDPFHPIRFIDFGIMKFIYSSEEFPVMYSENLHQSLRNIFINCPSCYSYSTSLFAQEFHPTFKTYPIEQMIHHLWQ